MQPSPTVEELLEKKKKQKTKTANMRLLCLLTSALVLLQISFALGDSISLSQVFHPTSKTSLLPNSHANFCFYICLFMSFAFLPLPLVFLQEVFVQ